MNKQSLSIALSLKLSKAFPQHSDPLESIIASRYEDTLHIYSYLISEFDFLAKC